MRPLLILFLFSSISISSIAQSNAPSIIWQHCYGGSLDDFGYGIAPYSDGGFLFCGCAGSSDGNILGKPEHGGTCDYWAARIDADSNVLHKLHLGGTGSDVAKCTFETADGGIIIAGNASSNDVDVTGNHGDLDFWVVRADANYTVQWKKCYGGSSYDDFGAMRQLPDYNFILCGGTQSNDDDVSGSHGSSDFWLVKTDATGNLLWQKCFGGSDYEKAYDVKRCIDGGFIMVGFTASQDGQVVGNHSLDFDGWVVKTDSDGNLMWSKCLGGTGQDGLYKVVQLQDENFLACGYSYSNDGDLSGNHGDEDAWLILLDSSGAILWSKSYGGSAAEEFSVVKQDIGGKIYAAGYSKSSDGDVGYNRGSWDYFLAGIDENGTLLWDSTYGGVYDDVCNDIAINNTGSLAMIGYSKSDSNDVSGNHGMDTSYHPLYISKADYWVVNVGNVVGIHEIPRTSLTIIPTLAHDAVQIQQGDADTSPSDVIVTNANGQIVISKLNIRSPQLLLHISSLPRGMYYVTLKNARQMAVGRFVKM